jgi:hypothetical protein
MALQRKALDIVLFTSLGIWSLLLLTMFLPATGLLTRSPSGNVDGTLLNLLLVSGAVASVTCFVTGLEELDVTSKIACKLGNARTNLARHNCRRTGYTKQVQDLGTEISARVPKPSHEFTWRREEYRIKGQLRSMFRDIKTGRFIKNPQQ